MNNLNSGEISAPLRDQPRCTSDALIRLLIHHASIEYNKK